MTKNLEHLIADIEREVNYTRSLIGKDSLDARVMDAIASVPREHFVPEGYKHQAYENGPLPIGYRQTISQPYIVALMTDLLTLQPEHQVLEVGTGSGYQTAILARLCSQVYTLERIPELSQQAVERLEHLQYNNIQARVANGYSGWPEHAPYDGIIVTAAASHIPGTLVEQLKPGGKMVIPIGLPHLHQILMLLSKDKNQNIKTRDILDVAFVPLIDDDSLKSNN